MLSKKLGMLSMSMLLWM